jgi:DNA-binding CsgD family transcriptional regulator
MYRGRVPSAWAAVLLEREQELGIVRERLDRARDREGTLILIEGPAGAGKTELVRAGRSAAASSGMVVLEARGSELEQSFAFGVVRQLLEPVVSSASGALLAGAAAPAARLFEADDRSRDGADPGFEALHGLYWLVVNLADTAPVLVLVDDCHWADPESLRFLHYLAQRLEGLAVAMLLAGRPTDPAGEDGSALWALVRSHPDAVAVFPRPLTEDAAAELARARLGEEAAPAFCRACHAATGGNPLYLRELLRALEAAGISPSDRAAEDVQSVGPAAVSRFVLHRLATLSPACADLARAVAVLGDDSRLEPACRVSGLTEATARAAADELVRADIFDRGERLGFVHPIVRAALYEDLAPGERQGLHAAAATALGAQGASAERVTAHLLLTTATGDQDLVRTLRTAAAGAARRGAPRAAVIRLRRALAEEPPASERATILTEIGRYEIAATSFDAAEESLLAALSCDVGPEIRADAASWLARCAIVSSGQGSELAAEALASLTDELRESDRDRSLVLGSELLVLTAAVPQLRHGLPGELARFRDQARGHAQYEAVADIHDASERLFSGAPASEAVAQVLAALAAGLPPSAANTAGLLALITLRLGERYDVANPLLDAALSRARDEGHATRLGIIYGERAMIALAQGALHDALIEAETGLLLVEHPHFIVPQLLAVAIIVQIERGELEVAAEHAAAGQGSAVAAGRGYGAEFLVARARLRIAQGEVENGVQELLRCGERVQAFGARWPNHWQTYAAPAIASLGDVETAARLAREQLEVNRRVGAPGALGRSLRTAAAAIEEDERLELLQEAVAVLERSNARLELAYALADLGAELCRCRRRREGRDVQRRAIEVADQCGAIVLAERARAELQSGPGRRARVQLTGPSALTAAEWRTCRQALEGHTNREIAQAMFVTEKTVERHLSSAYHKLEIRSRFQLSAALGE